MYIHDVEKRAKGRELQKREGKSPRRLSRSAVRKALEDAIMALDRTMNEVDRIVEDFWTEDDGKAMAKGLPAKNSAHQSADYLYLAKGQLFRAVELLQNSMKAPE